MFLETPKGDIVNVDDIIAVEFEYLNKITIGVHTDSDIITFEYEHEGAHYDATSVIERHCICAYPRWALAGVKMFRADKIKSIVRGDNGYATIKMHGGKEFRVINSRVDEIKQGLAYRLMADSKPNLVKVVFE